MNRRQVSALALAFVIAGAVSAPVGAAKPPASWDGLVLLKSKKLDAVYLQPGADFRVYTKVMLDPTEIAFEKNWRRDYNSSSMLGAQRITETEVQELIVEGVKAASDLFAEASQEGGYAVVNAAGPDVLRVRTAVLNIRVSAPDQQTASRSYSFANEAGSAVLVVEVRDSMTGALMGRAVDGRVIGDTTVGWRNQVTNRSDFRRTVKDWASTSIRGLDELKARSPITDAGTAAR